MRTTLKQNVIYNYRLLDAKEEIKCHLTDAFFSRRDYIPVESEEYSDTDRVLIIGSIIAGIVCLYGVMSFLV